MGDSRTKSSKVKKTSSNPKKFKIMADVLDLGNNEEFGDDNERQIVMRNDDVAAMDEDAEFEDDKISKLKEKAKKRKGRGFDSRLGDRYLMETMKELRLTVRVNQD